jgi:peptidoglycan hydrolase-like protein with peptidoglycan-binding domain
MNRTLTAAVALAAALGTAGLAQAQMNSTTSTPSSPMTTSPSATQPGMAGTPNPQPPPGATGTYGASPQASQMQGSQQASPSQIQQAQQQLKSAGLYRGAVDGVMGPETQTALSQFQHEQGLPQTAQLDQQTLSRLNGSDAGGQSSASPRSMTPSTPSYPAGTQNPATQNSTGGAYGTTNGGANSR